MTFCNRGKNGQKVVKERKAGIQPEVEEELAELRSEGCSKGLKGKGSFARCTKLHGDGYALAYVRNTIVSPRKVLCPRE